MIFNSTSFFLFFLLVYVVYRLLHRQYLFQNRLLLVASYVFYGWWDWRFPVLMGFTTFIDYIATGQMRRSPNRRGLWLAVSVLNNLGVLFVLKYFGFFQENILAALSGLGVEGTPLFINVLLPVGISFYTFQRMTFVLDVYREESHAGVGFFDFALFVSFFPLLLSGPIERAKRLIPQLCRPRDITGRHMEEGAWLVTWGLFKKVYVADNLAAFVDPVFAEGWHGSGSEALVAVYAYAFQIYCDFSGYSDVAKGIAKFMGFDVMVNFQLPYFATNPSEFWRRWHVALSTWLRDYVYIPLGGNRGGVWRTNVNLMITMILVGLWHGAAWTFVLWGLYHGTLLAVHRFWSGGREKGTTSTSWIASWVKGLAMFQLVCVGWLLFRATSAHQAAERLMTIVSDFDPVAIGDLFVRLSGYLAILLFVQIYQWFKGELLVLERAPTAVRGVVYGALVYLIVLHGGTSDSFIYFQF
jgi:alginate O-acetyltransferase complex protein AlgI